MTSQITGDATHRLAANVRKARASAGLSQRALAEKIDTDPGLVSKWERGVHAPSGANLAALVVVTGRDLAWFYTDHSADEPRVWHGDDEIPVDHPFPEGFKAPAGHELPEAA